MTTRQAQNSSGYKRNWPKWLALYLAIGGIVFLIVYFVTSGGGGGSGGGGY
jgi:hypothetical protein